MSSTPTLVKARDVLSPDEIRQFSRRSDLAGALMVAGNWGMIAAIFAVTAAWTHPVTVCLAVVLLAGRQLALAVLMHEAGHQTLFRTAALNHGVGQWLCAYPVMGDVDAYGTSHRVHHRYAGTTDDPDLPNYRAYPVSRASFTRKVKRDISGQTGLQLLRALAGAAGGRNVMLREGESIPAPWRGLAVNLALAAVLAALGVGALYLMWLLAYFFVYPLLARIRQVAEHGNVVDLYHPDPRNNTRTTYANPLERLLVCPCFVNYHVEHHLLASVPCHRLPALHQRLLERGYYVGYEDALARGYRDVLKRAVPEFGADASAA